MQEPAKFEMMEFIYPISHEDHLACEVAIYYFAEHYHGGQGSNLYSALSTSPFKPGRISSLDSEGEDVKMLYEELETKFAS